jgi:hypothetical protein
MVYVDMTVVGVSGRDDGLLFFHVISRTHSR